MAPFGPDSADGQERPFGSVELRIRLERRYRAEILSRSDPCNEIRAPVRRYELILWRCAADFVPKSAILRFADVGQRKNGRSGGQKQIENGCAWAVLGGIQSGWDQFGAVKKLFSFIAGLISIGGSYLYIQINS